MSKTPRKRDWPALLEKAREADRQLTAEELDLWRRGILDGTANGWHVDLVHALQRAIEGRDRFPLLLWLDAGMPIPGFLSPLLADALRPIDGAPTKLTALHDLTIREHYDRCVNFLDKKRGAVKRTKIELATTFGVSVDLIEASLERTRARV